MPVSGTMRAGSIPISDCSKTFSIPSQRGNHGRNDLPGPAGGVGGWCSRRCNTSSVGAVAFSTATEPCDRTRGDCSSFGAQFLKAPSSAASYPPVATAGARPPAERYWRKLARRQISNRSHGGSNLVSDAATRILKIRDQRLASEIGRLRQKI